MAFDRVKSMGSPWRHLGSRLTALGRNPAAWRTSDECLLPPVLSSKTADPLPARSCHCVRPDDAALGLLSGGKRKPGATPCTAASRPNRSSMCGYSQPPLRCRPDQGPVRPAALHQPCRKSGEVRMSQLALSSDSVAVITGGASGIGLAAAMRFARMGLRVCIADLGDDRLASGRRARSPPWRRRATRRHGGRDRRQPRRRRRAAGGGGARARSAAPTS